MFSQSFANTSYKSKYCNELPYLMIVAKVASKLKEKSMYYIDKKYSKLPSNDKNSKAKIEETKNAKLYSKHEICNNKGVSSDVASGVRYQLKQAKKFKKLCLNAKSKDEEASIFGKLSTFGDESNGDCQNWKECYNRGIERSCSTLQSFDDENRSCDGVSAPHLKYAKSLENEKSNLKLCKKIVNDSNTFLKWGRNNKDNNL